MAHTTLATAWLADTYSDPMPTPNGNAGILLCRPFVFSVDTALVVNDYIKLCKLPGSMGIYLKNFLVELPDLDSGAAIVVQIGDSTAVDRFITTTIAGAGGQAATTALNRLTGEDVVLGSLPCRYVPNGAVAGLGDDDLVLKVQTGPNTGTTGVKIIGYIEYVQFGVGPVDFGN